MTEFVNTTGTAICKLLYQDHFFCHIVATHDDARITTAEGIMELDNNSDKGLRSAKMRVLTGGTDAYASVTGKVTIVTHDNVIVNTIYI